jgi:O-antigen/teichoic acid export membrane protein
MASFKKNVTSNVITQFLKLLFGIGVSVIIARGLGPEGKGVIAFTLMIISLVAGYGHLGIFNAHEFFFSQKTKFKEEDVLRNNITFGFLISFFWIFIIILLSPILLKELIQKLGGPFIFVSVLFTIPILMIGPKLGSTLFVRNKVLLQNKILLLVKLFSLLVISFFFLIKKLNIKSYLLIYFFIELLLLLIYFFNLRIPFKFYLNKILLKKEANFGFQLFLAALFITLTYRVDIFFIQYFLSFKEVGIYSIGVGIAEKAWLIPVSIGSVLYAKLLNLKSEKKSKSLTYLTTKFSFFVCFLLILPLICLAPFLVKILYGSAYFGSAVIIQLLLPGILFAVMGKVMYSHYVAKGKPLIHTLITFFCFLFNLILNLILIPRFGIIGASLASTFSYIGYGLIYLLIITYKDDSLSFFSFFFPTMRELRLVKQIFLPKK